MSFLIYDIKNQVPQSGFRYLFDANIWLAVLDEVFDHKIYTPYTHFFNAVYEAKDTSIAIPSTLLSEILNRLIRDVYYKEFIKTSTPSGADRSHFKNIYRKSRQYEADLENACASLGAYHKKIQFISDDFDSYSCRDLIKKIPAHLDINDYLYTKLAIAKGLILITHDEDFQVEDVTIYTTRNSLLALMP